MTGARPPADRRRADRRSSDVRLGEYPLPELRKALLTAALLLVILALFLYMVRDVLVAVIAGIVVGAYLVPFQDWLCGRLGRPRVCAIATITLVTVPLVAILVYSWIEISGAAAYLDRHHVAVADRLSDAIRRLPFLGGVELREDLSGWVAGLANRITEVVGELQEALGIIAISVAVFLFTVFYILTDHVRIVDYLRSRVPGRYRDLTGEVIGNIRAVVYGALYATFLTQLMKSSLVLAMNLAWDVPLAVVLAILSFFIGFFPIVGSWTVYVPVSIYLIVFRGDVVGGLTMVTVGLLVITLFMSMYLRPKIAAERSRVLNFYWMFIGLVTGVYTFGLMGIVIGPVLLGVLKAVFDTLTGDARPVVVEPAAEPPRSAAG